jgi:hypothetical protein
MQHSKSMVKPAVKRHFMATLKCLPLLFLTFTSCSTKIEKKEKTNLQQPNVDSLGKVKDSLAKIDNFDTLTIDRTAAVFYSPDSIQIAKRKKEIGEDNFYAGADDYLNYLQTSRDFLDSVKLPILEAKDKKYLKFVRDNKSQTVIKLDTLPELWGIYLFSPGKKEKLVNMTLIDEEYNSYFK